MRSIPVLVAGGGASGMVAAIEAAKLGANVTVIEKKNKPGKKILATGNGRFKWCYSGLITKKSLIIFGKAV